MKKRPGRPEKEYKKIQFSTSLYPDEIEMIRVGAEKANLSMANYLGAILRKCQNIEWDAYLESKKLNYWEK